MILTKERKIEKAELETEEAHEDDLAYGFYTVDICDWVSRFSVKPTTDCWREMVLTRKSDYVVRNPEWTHDRITNHLLRIYRTHIRNQQSEFENQFNELASQWYRETRKISAAPQIVLHPAYQKIIGMGKDALPFILKELKRTRGHWLWALSMITRNDQAKPGQTFSEAVDSWISWGEETGYI